MNQLFHPWLWAAAGPALVAATLGLACSEPGDICAGAEGCRSDAEAQCLRAPVACVEGRCVVDVATDRSCDDGDACSVDDRCLSTGRCVGRAIDCAPSPVDLCAEVLCDQSPPPTCVDGHIARRYEPWGLCRQGICEYAAIDQPCSQGCAEGYCLGLPAPEIRAFGATPASVSYRDPQIQLRWQVRDAQSMQLRIVEDGRVLCGVQQPCVIEGSLSRGSMNLVPPFEQTTYRLTVTGRGGQGVSETRVHVEAPRYPDMPFNDIGVWMLEHRPLPDPFRFVVLADYQYSQGPCPRPEHSTRVALRRQIRMLEPPPAFVIAAGDVLINGNTCEFETYFEYTLRPFFEEAGIPWFTVPGNHDIYEIGALEYFRENIGDDLFSFDVGRSRFIGLNMYERARSPRAQFGLDLQAWLEQQLQEAQVDGQHNVFIFNHYPPRLPTDVDLCRSNLLNQFEHHFFDGRRSFLGADRFMELIERYAPPVRIAFFGHVHAFANYRHNNVRYLVSGGGADGVCPDGGEFIDNGGEQVMIHDGLFNHFTLMTVDEDAGRYRGQIIKKNQGTTPLAGYGFDQDSDDLYGPSLLLPFADDFSRAGEPLDRWQFFTAYGDDDQPLGYARWRQENGVLAYNGNLHNDPPLACPPSCDGALVTTHARTWSDYVATVTIAGDAQARVGVHFYLQKRGRDYQLVIDRAQRQMWLLRRGDSTLVLASSTFTDLGRALVVETAVQGSAAGTDIRVSVNGARVVSYVDGAAERLRFGGFGLSVLSVHAVTFDDVGVRDL